MNKWIGLAKIVFGGISFTAATWIYLSKRSSLKRDTITLLDFIMYALIAIMMKF